MGQSPAVSQARGDSMFYVGILTAYEGDDIDLQDALELAECRSVGELYERAACEQAHFLSGVAARAVETPLPR